MNCNKKFDIRLTDIWNECQKELIEMKDKIKDLKTCLKTSEQINKHLIKCNEVLVAIIEKCRIDNHSNKGMNDLIKTIKREEEFIETEKENLKKVKNQINGDFNERKVMELIAHWNQNKPVKLKCEDKSIQTLLIDNDGNHLNNHNDHNDHNDDSDDNDDSVVSEFTSPVFEIKSVLNIDFNETDFETKVESKVDSNHFDSSDFKEVLEEDNSKTNISTKSDDFDINDVSDSHEDSDGSDFDKKKPKNKNVKKSLKESKETSLRTQRINAVVLQFKVGDKYVCNVINCGFSSGVKRVFYSHRNSHREGEPTEPINGNLQSSCDNKVRSARSIRINRSVLPYKVGLDYICTKENCQFKCTARLAFYRHLRSHDNPVVRRCPREVKVNDSDRPYVCDWPSCAMAFRRPQHLTSHRKRHKGERDFTCDWPGCGAQMYTSHNYYTHRLTHTDERPQKCDWPGCTYSCNQKWALIAHGRIHTGEKPYLCPFPECGYRCSQPCTLISHKRKHTGEKPYICDVNGCGKRFSALAGIWNHKKIHAKEDTRLFALQLDPNGLKNRKNDLAVTEFTPFQESSNEDQLEAICFNNNGLTIGLPPESTQQ